MNFDIKVSDDKPNCADTVTVHYNGKTGTAKCCPDDKFDLNVGFELALERAKNQIKETSQPHIYRIGDPVRIINSGCLYTTYTNFVNRCLPIRYAVLWKYGELIPNSIVKDVFKIVALELHDDENEGIIAAIQTNKCARQIWLINTEGLCPV